MHTFRICFEIKLIALVLAVATAVTLIPRNLTAHGFDGGTELPDHPDLISPEDAENYSIVSRDSDSEVDLNSLVFNTSSGEKVEFFYPYDVKYIDTEGRVCDKDTSIVPSKNGFVSEGTGVRIAFPEKISEGVSISSYNDKYTVSFFSLADSETYSDGALNADNTTVKYIGAKESLEYAVSYSGLKENIILNEYCGISSWSFRIHTNGLLLSSINGQYILADGSETIMSFGSILAFTADDKNNVFGEMTVKEVTEAEEYILTVTVPEVWLSSKETSYPVTIDPSITVNYASGSSSIQDEMISSTTAYSATYDVIYVGKGNNNEKLRGAVCFPNLDLSGKCVTSASLELRDVMCESTPTLVEMYEYTGGAWTEATVLTWSNAASYGDLLDSHYVKWGNGNTGSDPQRYSFDITALAQKWASGYASPSQGVLIKTTDAFENASGSFHRCFASKDYGNNTHKPSLVITYATPKGLNPSYSYDTRTLDSNVTVYNYHNFGNVLLTYTFDTKTKGFPLPLFFAYNSTDDSWRLSTDETVTADAGRYKYTDGYGTEYYFSFKETGVYENEALGRQITVSSASVVMETGDGVKKIFDPLTGRISTLEYDKDVYTYTYGTQGIASIEKNNDVLFEFGQSVYGLTSAFGYTFGYSGILLNSITDKYGNTTSFTRSYVAMIILTSLDVQSSLTTDGIRMTFDENTRRVAEIVSFRGSVLNDISSDLYTYGTGWTSSTSAFADLDADDPQNTVTTYIFDVNGRTVNEYVMTAGSSQSCLSASDYRTDDICSGNITGAGGTNMISDSSFETSAWSGGSSYASDGAVFGAKVMTVYSALPVSLPLSPTVGRYTFSAYVKGEGAKASLLLADMTGATAAQSKVFPLDDNWVRIYFSFEISGTGIWFLKIVNSGTAPIYADCVLLEKNDTPTTYNALQNSCFDSGTYGWTGGSYSTTATIFGPTVSIGAGSAVSQTVTLGGVPEDTSFTVSGWLLPGIRQMEAEIKLTFNGTNTTSVSVPFNGFCYGMPSFCCAQVLPPEGTGNITSVTYEVVNRSVSSSINCDNLLLSFGNISRAADADYSSQGLTYHSYGDGTCMVTGIGTCEDKDLIIPERSPAGDTVIYVNVEAFKDDSAIESVTIPDSVQRILSGAFRNCSNLKVANLGGESLERISDSAFYNCSKLETVYISGNVYDIDSSAFCDCSSLKTLILPESLTSLGAYVFSGCEALKKVTVPSCLTELPAHTFEGDSAGLQIYYTGSAAEWTAMDKGTAALPANYTLTCDSEVKNGSVYKYTYSNGVKTSVSVITLESSSPVESYRYDADGNVTEYTDSRGNTTLFEYDEDGDIITLTTPEGRETGYSYNAFGDVVSETDACGNTTTFTYYANGLLNSQSKDGTTVTYSYTNGLVTGVTVSGSNTVTYAYLYNAYGNLTSITAAASQPAASYTYTCGGRGKLSSKTESNGYCESYKYDSSGNLVETSVSGNAVYQYFYDLSGCLIGYVDIILNVSETSLLTPDGGMFTYTFDSNGVLLKTVTDSGEILFSDGSMYESIPEGVSSQIETDDFGRETEYTLKLSQNNTETDVFTIVRTYLDGSSEHAPNEVVTEAFSEGGSFRYIYDECGRLTEVYDGSNTLKLKYTYDAKGQLTREDNSFSDETYVFVYDFNGNITARLTHTFNIGTLGSIKTSVLYSYSANNKDLLSYYNGLQINYSGLNPTNWRNASSLTWRGRQLISRTYNGVTSAYEYNSDGLRTKKTTGTDVTEYVWEGNRLIREVNPDRTITFLYDGGELAGFSTGGSNYYYAKDSFGVISYVYNEDGSLYASYKYDAWGSLITAASTLPSGGDINPIRYKSYYYDADTGFYYLQSRYYDPMVGRFLNADDPSYLGISGTVLGWNMFAYCENDAINHNDPSGHSAIYLVSFKDVPVAGHAVLYYQFFGIWYKTQFEASEEQFNAGLRNSFKIFRAIMKYRNLFATLILLNFIGCTTATITNKAVGASFDKLKDDIHKFNKGAKYLCVFLPGYYGYIYDRVERMNNSVLPYSLLYANCAHYVEYLLLGSLDPLVASIALLRQKTPIKLFFDFIVSGYKPLNI